MLSGILPTYWAEARDLLRCSVGMQPFRSRSSRVPDALLLRASRWLLFRLCSAFAASLVLEIENLFPMTR